MILFQNSFIDVVFHNTECVVAGIWKNTNTLDFTDEIFRECMSVWFEEIKKITKVNVLADTRLFLFTITPETQTWINEHIIGLYPKYGVSKLGFLMSPDLFAQVSIEQTIDEKAQAFQVSYFNDETEVMKWLCK